MSGSSRAPKRGKPGGNEIQPVPTRTIDTAICSPYASYVSVPARHPGLHGHKCPCNGDRGICRPGRACGRTGNHCPTRWNHHGDYCRQRYRYSLFQFSTIVVRATRFSILWKISRQTRVYRASSNSIRGLLIASALDQRECRRLSGTRSYEGRPVI